MNPNKNIHFTVLVRINKQQHEFNFRKRTDELYDADTNDERGNRYYFKMIKENNRWTMQGTIPEWIGKNEEQISKALTDIEAE